MIEETRVEKLNRKYALLQAAATLLAAGGRSIEGSVIAAYLLEGNIEQKIKE